MRQELESNNNVQTQIGITAIYIVIRYSDQENKREAQKDISKQNNDRANIKIRKTMTMIKLREKLGYSSDKNGISVIKKARDSKDRTHRKEERRTESVEATQNKGTGKHKGATSKEKVGLIFTWTTRDK